MKAGPVERGGARGSALREDDDPEAPAAVGKPQRGEALRHRHVILIHRGRRVQVAQLDVHGADTRETLQEDGESITRFGYVRDPRHRGACLRPAHQTGKRTHQQYREQGRPRTWLCPSCSVLSPPWP